MNEQRDVIAALAEEKHSPGEKYYAPFTVTPELRVEAEKYVGMYPEGKEQSAVLPLIHLVQEKHGYISPKSVLWIAEMCKSTPIHVQGIVSFYPGIRTKCPGKWHIRICHTIACALSGGEELLTHVCGKIGIDPGAMNEEEPMAVSSDGVWSIEAVECLAACGFGPNMMINDTLYNRVDAAKAETILAEYAEKA